MTYSRRVFCVIHRRAIAKDMLMNLNAFGYYTFKAITTSSCPCGRDMDCLLMFKFWSCLYFCIVLLYAKLRFVSNRVVTGLDCPISQIPECFKYHKMHHFVTEMFARVHISVTSVHCGIWDWRIVGFVRLVSSITHVLSSNSLSAH